MKSRSKSPRSSLGMETSSRSHSREPRRSRNYSDDSKDRKTKDKADHSDKPVSKIRSTSRGPPKGSGRGSPHRSASGHSSRKHYHYSPYRRRDSSYGRRRRDSPYSRRHHDYGYERRRYDDSYDRHRYNSPHKRRHHDSNYDRYYRDSPGHGSSRYEKYDKRRKDSTSAPRKPPLSSEERVQERSKVRGSHRERTEEERPLRTEKKTHSPERWEPEDSIINKGDSKKSVSKDDKKRSVSNSAQEKTQSPSPSKEKPPKNVQIEKKRRSSSKSSFLSSGSESEKSTNSPRNAKTNRTDHSLEKAASRRRRSTSSSYEEHPRKKKPSPSINTAQDACIELNRIKNISSGSRKKEAIRDFMEKYSDPKIFTFETADASRHNSETFEKEIVRTDPVEVSRQIVVESDEATSYCLEFEYLPEKEASNIALYVWSDGQLTRCYEFEDTNGFCAPHRQVEENDIVEAKIWAIVKRYMLKKGVQASTECRFYDLTKKYKHQSTFPL